MSDKKALLQAFASINKALLNNDLNGIKRLFAADYTGYNIHGEKEDIKTVLDAYQPGAVKLETLESHDLDVKIVDNIGFISGIGYVHGFFKNYEFAHRIRFLDIFIYRDAQWKYYLSQGTELPG